MILRRLLLFSSLIAAILLAACRQQVTQSSTPTQRAATDSAPATEVPQTATAPPDTATEPAEPPSTEPGAAIATMTQPPDEPATDILGDYLDDRSDPVSVLRSYVNAINRQEYARAYGYWQNQAALGTFEDFREGYANTGSVELTTGTVGGDAGAGNYYFTVPVALESQLTDGTTQTFAGCYTLHLGSPAAQAEPPFKPLGIISANVHQVAGDASLDDLLADAAAICQETGGQPPTFPGDTTGETADLPKERQPQPGDEELLREDVQIETAEILTLESFPPQYRLHVTGWKGNPCQELRVTVDDPDAQNRILVEVYTVVEPDFVCTQQLERFDITIPLGSHESGQYTVWLNGEQVGEISAGPAQGETDGAAAPPGDLQDRIAEAVAEEMNVTVEDVTFVSVEQVDWTDSCLGAGGPAETCLQVVTPGYRAIVEVNGQQIEVRTALEAEQIRIVNEARSPIPTPETALLPGIVYRDEMGLWQVNAVGQPVVVASRFDAQLSPDGEDALYIENGDVWITSLASGEARNITAESGRAHLHAQWWPANPDTLVLTSLDELDEGPNEGRLTLVNRDGSDYQVVASAPSNATPAPGPDGESIAYDEAGSAWLYHLDRGREPFDLAAYNLPTGVDVPRIAAPAWSPDGSQLAWVMGVEGGQYGANGSWEIVLGIFDLEEGTVQLLHPFVPLGRGGWFPNPIWSTDGQWISFTVESQEDPAQSGRWVTAVDGSSEEQLSSEAFSLAVWSPPGPASWQDGAHLIVDSVDPAAEEPAQLIESGTWQASELPLPAGSVVADWRAP